MCGILPLISICDPNRNVALAFSHGRGIFPGVWVCLVLQDPAKDFGSDFRFGWRYSGEQK